jgi:peptidoglycan/xylan/chitin deacetylase (PgdA/CDA1 family)
VTSWLDPLRRALDDATRPIPFFFRDDDAGWQDDRLLTLMAVFRRHGSPLDLAVIPGALGRRLAHALRVRVEASPGLCGLHQHGYAHENHEDEGRKHEFGPSRDGVSQRQDIERGAAVLHDLLGGAVDPIFTPPWNRCTTVTGTCLVELGFSVLSRESRALPLNMPGLQELPVHVDWQRRSGGVDFSHAEIARALAVQARGTGPVGVMLHHAVMTDADLQALTGLLTLLCAHDAVEIVLMRELIGGVQRPQRRPVTAAAHL